MQTIIDLPLDNPIAFDGKTMSNQVAKLIADQLRTGNFATSTANDEFLISCVGKTHFSIRQKDYLYSLARKFKLI